MSETPTLKDLNRAFMFSVSVLLLGWAVLSTSLAHTVPMSFNMALPVAK